MIYFQFPSSHPDTYQHLCVRTGTTPPTETISHSLSQYLNEIKNHLSVREKEWDIYKKYTNTYEYIHTVVPYKKKAVSKYKPLSRSYFKMIELIHTFDLFQKQETIAPPPGFSKPIHSTQTAIQTFHLAEGPGGFIEAIANTRNNPRDTYYGITIQDDKHDGTIPSWKKSTEFLCSHPNVILEHGKDGTGNLLSYENFLYCCDKYASSMDVITGDGGFDFSAEFNKQEINMTKLLFAQICYALFLQKKGGSFILKIFDAFHTHTMDMLVLLTSMYKRVYMTKPLTSRIGNSEKYIVCKGFLHGDTHAFADILRSTFRDVLACPEQEYIMELLNIPKSVFFQSRLEEFNSTFGQQQIENIHYTISLIEKNVKTDKINILIKNNITKCVNWCMKYNVPYHYIMGNNIFLYPNSVHSPEYTENYSSAISATIEEPPMELSAPIA